MLQNNHSGDTYPPAGLWAWLARAVSSSARGTDGVWRELVHQLYGDERPTTTDDRPPTTDDRSLVEAEAHTQGEPATSSMVDRRRSVVGVWQLLGERTDPAQYRPCAVPDVAEEQVTENGQALTVIRSPRGNYLRLTPMQRELWRQMDGTRTVAQLATQAFLKFQQLPPIADLVTALRDEGFLTDQPVGVYRVIGQALEARTAEGWGRRVWRWLTGATWRVERIDGIYGTIYRSFGWLLFTLPFLIIWVLGAFAGLGSFGALLLDPGRRQLFAGSAGAVPLELAGLWLALLISFLLHESSHALAVKHYGRTLRAGGAMLYFGAPAFFVDTSDIWRSPRRARIIVSAAGPMCDLFVGGLAALAVLFAPDLAIAGILLKLAFTCYVATLFNLNPLLELDGYYILVDLLRMPDLRRRSLAFIRGPLWSRVFRAGDATGAPEHSPASNLLVSWWTRLSREERVFTIYGMLASLYAIVAVWFAWQFWNRQVLGAIRNLWFGPSVIGQVIAAALILLVVVPVVTGLVFAVYGVGRATLGWVIRRGYGRRPLLLAGIALMAASGLAFAGTRFGNAAGQTLAVALWALALAGLWSLRPHYRGAAIELALDALLLTTMLAAAGAVVQAVVPRSPLWTLADGLAFVCVLVAGFAVLLDLNLRTAPPRELLGAAALLMLAFFAGGAALLDITRVWGGWPAALQITAAAPAYFGTVALALLLPFLLALHDSRLLWSWILLWLAILAETAAYALDLRELALGRAWSPWLDILAAGLWAGSWLVHLATLSQIALDELAWAPQPSASEATRLQRAFQMTYAGCYRLLLAVFGTRRTQELDDRMDVYAATANWDVTLDRDEARIGQTAAALSLDAQGTRYAEVLRYTVQTIEQIAGAAFARRVIQAAYDALPWPERETASRLCFPDTPWARELSGSFGDTRTARLRLLRQVDLLLASDDERLEAVAHSMQEVTARRGDVLLAAGETPGGMWVIEAGEVVALSRTQAEVEMHRGDTFGAHEFLEGAPAGLTYRATVPATLLFVPGEALRALSSRQADLESRETLATLRLLERVSIFAGMPRHTLHGLAQIGQVRRFAPRQLIVREGVPSGVFYVIVEGHAGVITRDRAQDAGSGKLRVIAELGPEEFFGELELIRGTPPVATVVARTPLTAVALPHAAMQTLLLGNSTMARGLEQIGTGRLIALQNG